MASSACSIKLSSSITNRWKTKRQEKYSRSCTEKHWSYSSNKKTRVPLSNSVNGHNGRRASKCIYHLLLLYNSISTACQPSKWSLLKSLAWWRALAFMKSYGQETSSTTSDILRSSSVNKNKQWFVSQSVPTLK